MKPLVKWAGGKSQLVDRLSDRLPADFGGYFEPFIGGGALLLALNGSLEGHRVVINDVNRALVNLYECVKNDVDGFIAALSDLDGEMPKEKEDAKAHYYSMRERYNELLSSNTYSIESAALLVWINKHCFNGLYRVNGKGLFNVPFNGSVRASFDEENVRAVSRALSGVEILCGDFTDAVADAGRGDFVFFDSPYVPVKADSFIDYTADGFTYDDHVRLASLYRELDERGVRVMETNHNVELIHELYSGYKIEVVDVRRAINSDASKRTGEEVIIRNYE